MKTEDTNLEQVLAEEREALARRRQARRAAGEPGLEGWEGPFGVALSGGGIRSATMSLGFLEVLNRAGLLRGADYLSTVSGGGYLGAYVQAALHERRSAKDPYAELFSKDVRAALMAGRRYLAPGAGVAARFRLMRFVAAILVSMLLNLLWMLALVVMVGAALGVMWALIGEPAQLWSALTLVCLVVLAWHFSVHWLRPTLWSAGVLTTIEALLLGVAAILATQPIAVWSAGFPGWVGRSFRTLIPVSGGSAPADALASWQLLLASVLVFTVVGLLANPNLLTMHVFYKAGLARAYLGIVSKRSRHVRMRDLASVGGWTVGPYPLINGCVNLLRDPTLAGARASDHFLFSPLFCGSRLTGYRRAAKGSYASLELATAVTASGAALNPSMGDETSPVLAFLLSLMSLRLGYWTRHRKASAWRPTFWPWPLLAEAFQRTGKDRDVLNVADGGFIENLGIYELLRRECRLIVALDAGCDGRYEFGDLRNLVVRARQELGIAIEFRQTPEETIRPTASGGFSPSHFVIAHVRGLPGSPAAAHGYRGVIVYAKSSLRAPASWKEFSGDKSIAYKTYHPAFPHESTADQFFDEAQWLAYFNLGRFIAGDVIGVDVRKDERWGAMSVVDAFSMWSRVDDGDKLREHLNLRPASTPPGLASGVQTTPNTGSAVTG